jgi:NaMN:DMB phosphoribosyltransferase
VVMVFPSISMDFCGGRCMATGTAISLTMLLISFSTGSLIGRVESERAKMMAVSVL